MPDLFIRSGKLYQLYTNYLRAIFGGTKFSDKMDLTVRIRNSSNVEHRQAICLKLRDRFFPSLTMFGVEAKASICSSVI